jgi:hypothetical protein
VRNLTKAGSCGLQTRLRIDSEAVYRLEHGLILRPLETNISRWDLLEPLRGLSDGNVCAVGILREQCGFGTPERAPGLQQHFRRRGGCGRVVTYHGAWAERCMLAMLVEFSDCVAYEEKYECPGSQHAAT